MKRNDIESLKAARRRRVSEEIAEALLSSGMNRKEFAQAMGRQPSEVSKWLSGNHNFTCDLLEEISSVLGANISGAKDPTFPTVSSLVTGFGDTGEIASESRLREPSGRTLIVEMPSDAMEMLKDKAAKGAMTLKEYVTKIIFDTLKEKEFSVMDLCGSCPDFPSAQDLREERTANSFPEL